jgi:hypothetical protein
MRALVLLLAVIPCVASLADTAVAQSAGTGGTRQYTTSPQMVYPIRPRNGPAVSTPVPNAQAYYRNSAVVPFRRNYHVYIRR